MLVAVQQPGLVQHLQVVADGWLRQVERAESIASPPLKLVLLENRGQGCTLNHFGVEVPDTGAVEAQQARLAAEGPLRGLAAGI